MKKLYLLLILVALYSSLQGQSIIRLEYFIDTDPGYGSATNIAIPTSSTLNDFSFTIPVSALTSGFHTMYVRVKNSNSQWSTLQNRPFVKLSLSGSVSLIEYFIDIDPGFGNGTAVPFTVDTNVTNLTFDVPMATLNEGFHTLFIRTKDSNNMWSTVQNRAFVKIPVWPDITYIEYYIDNDPGQGKATSVVFNPSPVITDLHFSVDVTTLPEGAHKIYARIKNTNNQWSPVLSQSFNVCSLAAPVVGEAYEITSTSFKFSWNAVPGATSYDADLSRNSFETLSTGHITGTAAISNNLLPNTSYQFRVRAVNANCSSINSNFRGIYTLNCTTPVKPTISLSGANTEAPVLASSADAGNQWYKNGTAITGATSSTLTITSPGVYKVQVKAGECLSEFSEETSIFITAIEPASGNVITFHPNPIESHLTVIGAVAVDNKVLDSKGSEFGIVFHREQAEHRASVSHLSPGVYFLRVEGTSESSTLKFIKK